MKPTRTPTKKLFKEFNPQAELSIDEWRKVFVETEDPTEYTGAMLLVGSWKEWQRFKKEWPGFRDILEEWKSEIEIRIRAKAILSIASKAKDNVEAAKWIAEGKFNKRAAGKPSKAETERAAKVEAKLTDAVEDEIARVMDVKANVAVPGGQPN
jgi:hypothetical protein